MILIPEIKSRKITLGDDSLWQGKDVKSEIMKDNRKILNNSDLKTREEWHKEYAGEIDLDDFNTNYPNRKRINNQANALRQNLSCKREKVINYGKF